MFKSPIKYHKIGTPVWVYALFLLGATFLYAQGSGTPNTLRVITDSLNNLLITASSTQTLPLSQPTQFINTRLKTDASGNLNVVLAGITAGTGTATAKSGGIICQNLTSITDASIQNQWNTNACQIPANTLAAVGDTLYVEFSWVAAANGNTKTIQVYLAPVTATCSGSGGSLCSAGCQLQTNSTTASGNDFLHHYSVVKTSLANQKFYSFSTTSSGPSVFTTKSGTCTVDETVANMFAFGVTNTSAAAASITSSTENIFYFGR